jgi:hypothetical protein
VTSGFELVGEAVVEFGEINDALVAIPLEQVGEVRVCVDRDSYDGRLAALVAFCLADEKTDVSSRSVDSHVIIW